MPGNNSRQAPRGRWLGLSSPSTRRAGRAVLSPNPSMISLPEAAMAFRVVVDACDGFVYFFVYFRCQRACACGVIVIIAADLDCSRTLSVFLSW